MERTRPLPDGRLCWPRHLGCVARRGVPFCDGWHGADAVLIGQTRGLYNGEDGLPILIDE